MYVKTARPTQIIGNGRPAARAPGDSPRPCLPEVLHEKKRLESQSNFKLDKRSHWVYVYASSVDMIGYNTCQWQVVGSTGLCRKQCVYDLCSIHRAQLRKTPGTEPHPCQRCGKGTKSESWLCSKICSSDRAQKALARAEARAKRLHIACMWELTSVWRKGNEPCLSLASNKR